MVLKPETSQKIPLLLNKRAGSLYRKGLRKWLLRHSDIFSPVLTESAENAQRQAERLIREKVSIIAVAGGDGTLMNVAHVLLGTETALGILPSGSMNVFARELGIGSHRYDVALSAILGNERKEIDIFTLNGTPFLQLAGIGPDADIIRRITPKLKRQLGPASHIITALQTLKAPLPRLSITTDGGEILCGAQIILGNGNCYGGGAHLFHHAAYDDGKLDAAIIQRKHIGILMEVIFSMLQHGARADITPPGMEIRRFRRCVITTEETVSYQVDGDYIGKLHRGEELVVEKLKQKLTVCIPPDPTPNTPFEKLLTAPVVHALFHKIAEMRTGD